MPQLSRPSVQQEWPSAFTFSGLGQDGGNIAHATTLPGRQGEPPLSATMNYLTATAGLPLRLLEVGASAGLNLR